MDCTVSRVLLMLLVVSLLSSGCGGLATPPPPTVTRMPRPTPATEAATELASPPPTATPRSTAMPTPALTVTSVSGPTATPTSAPTGIPSPLATPTSAAPQAVVREGPLNVRTGPDTAYPRIGQLGEGAEVEVTGRNEEATWWQIAFAAGEEGRGWIATEYVQTSGEIAVEVVEALPVPPTPMPRFGGKIVFQERSGGRIFIINADGTGLRQLTSGLDPALSPDGTEVAFTRWEEPAGIYLINVDGTNERLLAPVEQPKCPEWSRDGTKIAFTHRSGGGFAYYWDSVKEQLLKQEDLHWKLGVADVLLGEFDDVPCDDYSFAPSWSTDGWWLVYDGRQGLMLTDPTGWESGRWQQVTYGVRDMSPGWSPEPRENPWQAPIAYMRFHNDHWEIYTILPNGEGRTRLTTSPLFEAPQNSVAPEWSPDGKWIAFLTDRRGRWEIWVMRSDGSRQQPLFPSGVLEGIEFRYEAQSDQVLNWGP